MLSRTQRLSDILRVEPFDIDGGTESAVHRIAAVALQQIVQELDITDPTAWIGMDQFGKEFDGGFASVE